MSLLLRSWGFLPFRLRGFSAPLSELSILLDQGACLPLRLDQAYMTKKLLACLWRFRLLANDIDHLQSIPVSCAVHRELPERKRRLLCRVALGMRPYTQSIAQASRIAPRNMTTAAHQKLTSCPSGSV